jgi:hypothetical protein
MSQERAFKTSAMTDVNRHILDAARESISYEQEWEFFCECGRDDCQERLKLTLDAYVALYDSGRAVLAEGHQLSQVERARRLRDDAEALRRQAEHQVRRVKKIRPGT